MFGRKKPEVLVVGAGPVGLFTALSLAKRGLQVQILDKAWRTGAHSYALALHPQSLELLEELDLSDRLMEQAYRVRTIGLYEGTNRRGDLRLAELREDFPFVAVMRQDVLESALEDELKQLGVKVMWNHRVSRLLPHGDRVTATVERLEQDSVGYAVAHTEWVVADSRDVEVEFVIGADGFQSEVRRALAVPYPEVAPAQHFAVFEFKTDVDFHNEMRLVLDDQTTNVLWPMPEEYCRWSFQLTDFAVPEASRHKDRRMVQLGVGGFPQLTEGDLEQLVSSRAPWFQGKVEEISWQIVVRFERRLAGAFGNGRLWLAGDAAHMGGPVGVQSMNIGFREANDLAGLLTGILTKGDAPAQLESYNREWTSQWRVFSGLEGGLRASETTDPWIRDRAARLLPCLPASGADLAKLARQIGLEL